MHERRIEQIGLSGQQVAGVGIGGRDMGIQGGRGTGGPSAARISGILIGAVPSGIDT
jgi:hypothetical protein